MQITFNTAETSMEEATALIALLASLGGRLPDNIRFDVVVDADAVRSQLTDEDRRTVEHAEINQGRRGPPLGVAESGLDPASALDAEQNLADNVDSKGTPWDARIHSERKAINADKTWRKRRGVSDETFNAVMTELHADDDAAPPPPPADDTVPLAPADEQVPAPPAPTAETPSEPAPAASAPVAGDPQPNGGQFADFASFVAAVAKHGKTYAELNEMAGLVGVAAFKDLKDHADKWDMFFSMIG